ncbi:MAG: hypothetical protein ACREI9_08355 [Nitrospiraceae bacterium]
MDNETLPPGLLSFSLAALSIGVFLFWYAKKILMSEMDFVERFLSSLGIRDSILMFARVIVATGAFIGGTVGTVAGVASLYAFICNCRWPLGLLFKLVAILDSYSVF